jgi:hypothetical protein
LTGEITRLLSLVSHEIPVYAVKSNSSAELLNRIMGSCAQIQNDHDSLKRVVTSVKRRAQLCIDNQDGHFE